MIAYKTMMESSDTNVKKYIYEDDTALVETVIYKYPDYKTRTVICVSVQSGCAVGCTFCGTGKKFLRDLTAQEIVLQVRDTFEREGVVTSEVERLQIMFMSMGEPAHNSWAVEDALITLRGVYPEAEPLLSTVGIPNLFFNTRVIYAAGPKGGLQFSIHHYDDEERNKLIPYTPKLTLAEIAQLGRDWNFHTGKKVFCNYVVTRSSSHGYERLFDLFPPDIFSFTFSVLCNKNESMKTAFINSKDGIRRIHDDFLSRGYDVRVFDPAGQDDIGGGCGQSWYFQNKIRGREEVR